MRSLRTPIILILLAFVVGGASYYTTDVRQKGEAERLRESRRVAEMMTARVEDLLAQESVSDEAAEAALSRWHSRYKYIPTEMVTADILEYLNGLTKVGFDSFDLKGGQVQTTPDFSKYTFDVQGVGEYEALYHVIWHLENNREFYRVHDLRMEYTNEAFGAGEGPLRDLVKFTFQIESFFGGIQGISAPEEDLAPVPTGLLLPHTASRDIFAPIVRVPKDAPSTSVAAPETGTGPAPSAQESTAPPARAQGSPPSQAESPPEGLDVEQATLKLVVGNRAIFEDRWGRSFTVEVGDEVIGGEIETVNAARGLVRARVVENGKERFVVRTLGDRPAER